MFSISNDNFFSFNKPQCLHHVPLVGPMGGETCRILGSFYFVLFCSVGLDIFIRNGQLPV